MDAERVAFIDKRIAELKARIAEGGLREAAIRSLVYIGMVGEGVDERAFNELRNIRAENSGLSLEAFKQILREQYFGLMLNCDAAMAAIPGMLPAAQAERSKALEMIRRTVSATGKVTGERAKRLAQIETLFAGGETEVAAKPKALAKPKAPVKPKAASKSKAPAKPVAPKTV